MRQTMASQIDSSTSSIFSRAGQWCWRSVAAAAVAWRWSPLIVASIGLLPLVIAFGSAGVALLSKDLFKWLVKEDGLTENVQVLFYLASFGMSLFVIFLQWRSGNRIIALLYCLFCLGLFFLTGEEISWGQRVWGWKTSAEMAAINEQDETNIHNLSGIMELFKWVQLLVGAYGTLLPLCVLPWLKSDRLRNLAWQLVPHPLLIPYFALIFVWKLYRNLFPELERFKFFLAKYNEVVELALAMGFFFFLVYQLRRIKTQQEL